MIDLDWKEEFMEVQLDQEIPRTLKNKKPKRCFIGGPSLKTNKEELTPNKRNHQVSSILLNYLLRVAAAQATLIA